MQRISSLFAFSAAIVMAFGVLVPRIVRNSGMSFGWKNVGYMVPNQALCFGMGFVLAFFAFAYSAAWFAPWNTRAAWWHLALSLALIIGFLACLIAHDASLSGGNNDSKALIAILILSPILFIFLQVCFGLDAFQRCLLAWISK